MKLYRFLLTISLFSLFLVLVQPRVHAMEYMNGNTVYLPSDRVVNGSLVATGQTVRIEGDVDGDLFCAGQDIIVTGVIRGDILCAGQTMKIATNVHGDVRAIGQTIDVSGVVAGNMTSLGQTVTVEKDSTIQGELMNWSEKLYLDGVVGRDVNGGGQMVTVDGNVGRNVSLIAESLIITKAASISGNVSYTSDTQATVDKSASIAGSVTRVEPTPESSNKPAKISPKTPTVSRSWNGGLYVIMALLVGGFLILFGKHSVEHILNISQDRSMPVFLYGLGTIVLVPIVIVLFAVTIIGIPVSLLLVFFFILSYFAGRSLVAMIVGRMVATRFAPSQKMSYGWNLVVGVLVCWVLFSIPIIGGILSFITTLFGFGFVTQQLVSRFTKK